MEHAEKLARATRLLELTMKPPSRMPRPDKPPPSPEAVARFDEMLRRRRAITAELYAERLTDEQLLAMEQHHNSDLMRSVTELMPELHEEVRKRFTALWGNNDTQLRMASGQAGIERALIVGSGEAPLKEHQIKAVQAWIKEERLIQDTHAALVQNYLKAVENGATGAELGRFYTPDAEQVEQPNRLNPKGGRSDLPTLLARAEKGKQLLAGQRYEILSLIASDQTVATEVVWTGTLAVALGTLAAGAEMRAHIAMFFEMKDGRIHRQRNYDCFEAW